MSRGLAPFDRRLLREVRSVRWAFAADVTAGLTGALLLLAQALLLGSALAAVATGEATSIRGTTLVALAAVIGLRALVAPLVEVSGRRVATTVMSTLRTRLVDHHLASRGANLPAIAESAGPDTATDGAALATAAVQGIDGLETYFARYLPQLVLAVTVPVAVITCTAVIDRPSAMIMVLTLPFVPVLMVLIGRSAAARSEANWRSLLALSTHFLDVVRGLPTLRAFNRGQAQIPKIRETTEQYRRTTMSTLRLAFLSGLVLDFASTLSVALVAVTLGVRLIDGSIALAPALTVLLLVPELYAPIRSVGALFHASTDGLAAAGQILELATAEVPTPAVSPGPTAARRSADRSDSKRRGPTPATPAPAPTPLPAPPRTDPLPDPRRHPIVVSGLGVQFPARRDPALAGIDLTVEPGEVLAVMGTSGAGKTTLGRVLLGLLDPTTGSVSVGGEQVSGDAADRWRHQVAWAPQRPTLLHASVASNIALGRPDASRADIETAAVLAGAATFIEALPAAWDTIIGDGGRGLSPGQRQRIGLARALLRDASLLVLDEPTAHLDPASVGTVAEAIDARRGKQTIVVITHDLTLATHADRSVTLTAGRLVAPTATTAPRPEPPARSVETSASTVVGRS